MQLDLGLRHRDWMNRSRAASLRRRCLLLALLPAAHLPSEPGDHHPSAGDRHPTPGDLNEEGLLGEDGEGWPSHRVEQQVVVCFLFDGLFRPWQRLVQPGET